MKRRTMLLALAFLPVVAFGDGGTRTLSEFPAKLGETDDTARIQRAVDATPSGVLRVPEGLYKISSTIMVTNRCSLELNKTAVLRAMNPMPYVLHVDNSKAGALPVGDFRRDDFNLFMTGGKIDGNGLASCMYLTGFKHFTMRDTTFLNGKESGLRVHGGYELIANNLYFKCVISGLAGNAALYVTGGDSHYTDCVAVDYTIGFRLRGGSNRLTRCHAWGGPLPPVKDGEPPEMLKDSVNFWLDRASTTILRDCYADTGKTGFLVDGWDARMLGCSYYNNKWFKLDDITIVQHKSGRLVVSDGCFIKNAPHVRVYDGNGPVVWHNMIYSGFGTNENRPGEGKFSNQGSAPQGALKRSGE